ncbi:MAG: 4-hydroxymandelate oxidase [Verrucomicrobiota bacterium]
MDKQPPICACISDYEALARERCSELAWEYIAGGAGDEVTLKWNSEAFHRIRLKPQVLCDVSSINTRIGLFGQELQYPLLLAPTAYHKLVHPEGELATARGAEAANAIYCVSSLSTTSVEEIAGQTSATLWFQLYVQKDRGFTRELVARAQTARCKAICLTVDTPILGIRHRETRVRFALPDEMDRPHVPANMARHRPAENTIYSDILDPTLTWKDVGWLRSITDLPILLKGIINPDDAARAVGEGADGIIVSNHGARNLDTVPASIEALPRVTDVVAGQLPVLFDGGIRRGTDILKALALGAKAVLIGRPCLYGLATNGAEGVTAVINMLRREFEMAMALSGRTTIAAIDRSVLWD